MNALEAKFARLGVDNAPGQEVRQRAGNLDLRGEVIPGTPVDFSHGDVDAFTPIPGSFEVFTEGYNMGGRQAYTEYRGSRDIREGVAVRLSAFTGAAIDPEQNLIITPGTQGALFLAMGALVAQGDKVAIVEPDYFANRKLVEFFGGELVPVQMDYFGRLDCAGLDLTGLENAFKKGARLFLFSNPNNPTGVVYTRQEIERIADLAQQYGAALIVDELYSRQIFEDRPYTHLCGGTVVPENIITITGPSKTESVSGFRLGVAFGSAGIIDRMEKLQAIMSLRAAGYSQSVLRLWFDEPAGWLADRVKQHQAIRDDLVALLQQVEGVSVRASEGGSYLFPKLPTLGVGLQDFVKILRAQAGVIVTPGTEFGPAFTSSFRINFSQDHKAAVQAMERIIELIGRYRN